MTPKKKKRAKKWVDPTLTGEELSELAECLADACVGKTIQTRWQRRLSPKPGGCSPFGALVETTGTADWASLRERGIPPAIVVGFERGFDEQSDGEGGDPRAYALGQVFREEYCQTGSEPSVVESMESPHVSPEAYEEARRLVAEYEISEEEEQRREREFRAYIIHGSYFCHASLGPFTDGDGRLLDKRRQPLPSGITMAQYREEKKRRAMERRRNR